MGLARSGALERQTDDSPVARPPAVEPAGGRGERTERSAASDDNNSGPTDSGADKGIPAPYVVSALVSATHSVRLGHASMNVTAQIYTHMSVGNDAMAEGRVTALIIPPPAGE